MCGRMLFGDNDSWSADVAWLWINSHTWPGWSVEVLTACPPLVVVAAETPPATELWTPLHPRRPFRESALTSVVHLRCDRDPRMALLRRTDMLVVGPRRRRADRPLHLGSTLEWLLPRPPAPMMLARRGHPTSSATLLHDGSPHATAATEAFCRLPWVQAIAVRVVTVDDGRVDVAGAARAASERLDQASIRHTVHAVQAAHGRATEELLNDIERTSPDLVVMGTRGLSLLERLRIGSAARAVAHHTGVCMLLAADHPDAATGTTSVATRHRPTT